jgi:C1A family cysteine protease
MSTIGQPFFRSYKLNYKFDRRKHTEKPYKCNYRGVLPKTVSLRDHMPAVLDQSSLGSCCANGTANALKFSLMHRKDKVFTPSRLFIYYNGRQIEGSPADEDTGLYVRDGLASVAKYGVCSENNWGYDILQFADKPPERCYLAAKQHKLLSFAPVPQTLNDLKSALAEGFPLVFGFLVYPSFMSEEVANTGTVPDPGKDEEAEGGHCTLICGYSDDTKRFLVQNSWSTSWGDKGYFTLSYDFVTNPDICSDFWVAGSF